MLLCLCVFFKQKTAYDMRIIDWSSDVCSSDLRRAAGGQHRQGAAAQQVFHAAAGGIAQARDFVAGANVEAAARVDAGVDGRERVGARGSGGGLGLGPPVVLSCSCRWLGTLTTRGRAGWRCTATPRRSKAVGGVATTHEHTRKRQGFPA